MRRITSGSLIMAKVTYRNRVRECRLRALIASQAELARRAGICRTAICALENNRIPLCISCAMLIRRAISCSLDDLYEETAREGRKTKRSKTTGSKTS